MEEPQGLCRNFVSGYAIVLELLCYRVAQVVTILGVEFYVSGFGLPPYSGPSV